MCPSPARRRRDAPIAVFVLVTALAAVEIVSTTAGFDTGDWVDVAGTLLVPSAVAYDCMAAPAKLTARLGTFVRLHGPGRRAQAGAGDLIVVMSLARVSVITIAMCLSAVVPEGRMAGSAGDTSVGALLAFSGLLLLAAPTYDPHRWHEPPWLRGPEARRWRHWTASVRAAWRATSKHCTWAAVTVGTAIVFTVAVEGRGERLQLGWSHVVLTVVLIRLGVALAAGLLDLVLDPLLPGHSNDWTPTRWWRLGYLVALAWHVALLGISLRAAPGFEDVIHAVL